MKRLTTAEFIERARAVHGGRYGYDAAQYQGGKKKVTIWCAVHGAFEQNAQDHLAGKGCAACVGHANPVTTTEAFVAKAQQLFGERYDYSQTVYAGSTADVIIICREHGAFSQRANTHLNSKGCMLCNPHQPLDTTSFVAKAQAKFGLKFDYTQVRYTDSKIAICIGCPEHGFFEQEPRMHLSSSHGCPRCGETKRGGLLTTKKFIERAQQIHGQAYDYSLVQYSGNKGRVTIICSKHGPFEQTPHKHIAAKRGCQKCAYQEAQRKQDEQGRVTYSRTKWQTAQKGRLAVLYLLRLIGNGETFYKIGITYDLKKRFGKHSMPYEWNTLAVFETEDALAVYELEIDIMRRFKTIQYKPNLTFHGASECYRSTAEILAAFPQLQLVA